jgi:hypothetical protein
MSLVATQKFTCYGASGNVGGGSVTLTPLSNNATHAAAQTDAKAQLASGTYPVIAVVETWEMQDNGG